MKVIVLKISDDLYDELERRAKEEGIGIVGNYIIKLISRELKKEREGVESPESLRDVVESIVEEVLEEKLRNVSVPEGLERDITEIVENMKEEIIDEISKKMERKLQSMINPWTEKIDSVARNLALLKEEIETLKEELERTKASREEAREGRERIERPWTEKREEFKEHRRKRTTAIDVLKSQKVIFEEEVKSRMRNVDALFRKLESQGAVIISTNSERVAVHPEAWEEFQMILRDVGPVSEEEVYEQLQTIDPKYAKLFKLLRESGLIYKDADKGWILEV